MQSKLKWILRLEFIKNTTRSVGKLKKKRPKAASLVQWPKAIEPGARRKRLARPSALVTILNLVSWVEKKKYLF